MRGSLRRIWLDGFSEGREYISASRVEWAVCMGRRYVIERHGGEYHHTSTPHNSATKGKKKN